MHASYSNNGKSPTKPQWAGSPVLPAAHLACASYAQIPAAIEQAMSVLRPQWQTRSKRAGCKGNPVMLSGLVRQNHRGPGQPRDGSGSRPCATCQWSTVAIQTPGLAVRSSKVQNPLPITGSAECMFLPTRAPQGIEFRNQISNGGESLYLFKLRG